MVKALQFVFPVLLLGGLGPAGKAVAQYQFESAFGSFGAAAGQFDDPRGVAVDSSGRIIVTESGNNRVQVCTDAGACTAFGSFGTESGQFDRPRGVAVDSGDRILVADRGNDRIQDCNSNGVCTAFGNSGAAVGQFESPRGIAVTADDRIVIADTDNDRIQICTGQGACTAFGSTGSGLGKFSSPSGVAVDGGGRIIVSDRGNNRIQVCTEQGSCTAFGGAGSATGQFDTPSGVAVDSQDRIIIVDRFNDRVQVCTDTGSCTAFGSTGSGNGQFDLPWDVAVDDADRIIVTDLGNNRIQIFSEPAPPPVSIDSFTRSPGSITAGGSVTLSWTVSHATSCTALDGTPAWTGIDPGNSGGSVMIQIDAAGNYTFTLRCTDGDNTVSASVVVKVNAPPAAFAINPGLNDAWFERGKAGQGFFIIVFADIKLVFLAWFTYDLERPAEHVTAMLGEPGHRWVTAQGPFEAGIADLDVFLSTGGVFDSSDPPVEAPVDIGDITIEWHDCETATLSYDIPGSGVMGTIELERIVPDNVTLCESLAGP